MLLGAGSWVHCRTRRALAAVPTRNRALKGLWTVPAGFLEMGESSAAGAARETWEEAKARVEVRSDNLSSLLLLPMIV